ncbi:tetratricopeptide repeat protein [Mucilaginibacter panaciglaebae]|uniref:Tetratricopeptide repeat protein n=1 Tax=Mucilaginibacter panaciglaebae TaxID=502331 RepID=A0ABP7WRC7_9SPHI
MKTYRKLLLTWALIICSTVLFAQSNRTQADSLLKQGVTLNDAGKFAEAVAKYDEILKTEPNNVTALYEKGFSLSAAGKSDEAIACFEKITSTANFPDAYVGLANIYDSKGDYEKALSYYMKGIAIAPKNRNLWFNLSVSYARQQKYPQSESAAAEAIKADPKHISSYRNYAVAAYLQGRNAEALLGLSNYLMFGVPANQSAGACQIVKEILRTSPKSDAGPIAKMQQETIVQAAKLATAGKTNLTPTDSLTIQLTAVYKVIKTQEAQYGSPFFSRYFGDFFGRIAESNYMDVFTHFIAVSLSPQDNLAWLKTRQDDIKAFNIWLNTQKRQTE